MINMTIIKRLATNLAKLISINYNEKTGISLATSDSQPWKHPFLTENNIKRFRKYSEEIWEFALSFENKQTQPLKCAFVCNMAQNMHKWCRLAQKYGVNADLFPNMMDNAAINAPEWEEFEGSYQNINDGFGFLESNPDICLEVPCHRVQIEGAELYLAYQEFCRGNRKPLLKLMAMTPGLRHEVLLKYDGFYPYFRWAKELSEYDVIYAASTPFAAYASGRPYCVFSVGGDLQVDCGRPDDYGEAMVLSFNAARFLMVSNPHALGHCRRLGLTNAVYLPYPMDDSRYSPGEGQARSEWEELFGKGIYVLTTSRLDRSVKGFGENIFTEMVKVARLRPQVRFVFLGWGNDVLEFKEMIRSSNMEHQFIILNPVGKKRLIDYYRSCDIVLDQLVMGYYGATALEAAAVGKPVIMKLRTEQYHPLYGGDIMPAMNANSPVEAGKALLELIDNEHMRIEKGNEMRKWLVRNHGEAKTAPLMLALLRLAADRIPLPKEFVSPLWDEENDDEKEYHKACLRRHHD